MENAGRGGEGSANFFPPQPVWRSEGLQYVRGVVGKPFSGVFCFPAPSGRSLRVFFVSPRRREEIFRCFLFPRAIGKTSSGVSCFPGSSGRNLRVIFVSPARREEIFGCFLFPRAVGKKSSVDFCFPARSGRNLQVIFVSPRRREEIFKRFMLPSAARYAETPFTRENVRRKEKLPSVTVS